MRPRNVLENTAHIKASVKDQPQSRQAIRDALAAACENVPITTVAGFTRVEPYRDRREQQATITTSR